MTFSANKFQKKKHLKYCPRGWQERLGGTELDIREGERETVDIGGG